MDDKARKNLFRAKMKEHEQKQEKRINSPLVRYNEFDKPVCRVCDIVLKSESFWQAHQVSRKHHEAINNIKNNAAGRTQINSIVKPECRTDFPNSKLKPSVDAHPCKTESFADLSRTRSSSELPGDFFDNNEVKRPKVGMNAAKLLSSEVPMQNQGMELVGSEKQLDRLSSDSIVHSTEELLPTSEKMVSAEKKLVKGALPEGFFDDKDSDLRARGIQPVKLDVKDEYKEFEKLIRDDLKDVDDRLEEEEIDAAELIEEAESLEQKRCKERVEMLKKKKADLKAARSARHGTVAKANQKYNLEESESSSDGDGDENFTVDWRAKHL